MLKLYGSLLIVLEILVIVTVLAVPVPPILKTILLIANAVGLWAAFDLAMDRPPVGGNDFIGDKNTPEQEGD